MAELTERSILVAIFPSRREAENALDDLRQADFSEKQLGFAIRGSDAAAGGMIVDSPSTEDGSGAAKGMVAGGVTGGVLGALAAVLIPGAGPILAAGILTTMLGFGAAGVATGGIFGAMMGLGVSEDEAKVYEHEFNNGRAIVTVKADSRVGDACGILSRHGATNIHHEDRDPTQSVSPS